MHRYNSIALMVIAAIFISGCAGMSKKECSTADWYAYGQQDGQAGAPASTVNRYVENCSKHDVPVNRSQYQQGWDIGIRRYCTPQNGYQVGLSGRELPMVCPSDMQAEFAKAHARGLTEFKIKRDISNAEQALSRLDSQQKNLTDQLIEASARELAGIEGTSPDEILGQIEENDRAQRTANGQLACASGNWFSAGQRDGQAGRSASSYRLHLRQCADYHPGASQSDYIRGQSDGIQQYCSYDTGFQLGTSGQPMSDICQGSNAQAQLQGYRDGQREFNTEVTIAGLKLQTSQLSGTIDSLTSQVADLDRKLDNTELTTEQKLELNRQLNRAQQQLRTSKAEFAGTNNELNCYIGDWRDIGRSDAEAGQTYDNRSERCDQYGVRVDTSLYDRGYREGLNAYCTRDNGRVQGELGQEYAGICPQASEAAFLDGYLPAFETYQRNKLRQQLDKDLKVVGTDISRISQTVDQLTVQLDRTDLTRTERLDLIGQIAGYSEQEQELLAERELMSAHRQCLTQSWFDLGKGHGLQGQDSQLRFLNCQRFDLPTGDIDYRRGLNEGLGQWCSYDRGYQHAISVEPRNQACTTRNIRPYSDGYRDGLAEQAQQQEVLELKAEKLDLMETRLPLIEELNTIDTQLKNTDLTADQRTRLEQRRRQLQQQLRPINQRLQEIEAALASLS